MKEEKKEAETLTVVDKRRFTSEGKLRPTAEAERAPEPPPPQPAPSREPKTAPRQESEPVRRARQAYDRQPGGAGAQKMDFETLVLSLSTSAMYQLGLVQEQTGGPIPTDFAAARQTIDLLGILQEKTRGNLSPQEAQVLEQVLYELRLAYVQVTSGGPPRAPKTKAGT